MKILEIFLTKYRRKLSTHRAQISVSEDLSPLACNRKIKEAIQAKVPFFVGRLGYTEGDALGRWMTEGSIPNKVKDPLSRVSGVFPVSDEELRKFAALYRDALSQANILGIMPAPYQGWLIKSKAPQAQLTDLSSLEPYFCEEPWSAALHGLKVLVVHPFAESILKQYTTARKQLFTHPQILPEFHLKVLKAPQTVDRASMLYSTWSHTLSMLQAEVAQEDFDVAIIGCGAYGFPLAASVKKMGKIALHLGGATQLLFGIKGRRWDSEDSPIKALMTDTWCFPLESERPLGWDKIEGGCYW